ncbi:MAG: stage II sporulation protein P, partial [Paraclostridium sp.]
SLQTIKSMQSTYDSIDIVIDLHRDGRDFNKMPKEEFHDLTTTQINGEDVAKFCFVYGERSENVSTIKALAEDITSFAENKYPGITRPVVPKKNAKFNQFTSNNHLLIEVGGNANTTQEAKVSVPYIADVISEYFKQKGI